MPKCGFNNKVAKHTLLKSHFGKGAAYFQNTFSLEHLWRAASAVLFNSLLILACFLTVLLIQIWSHILNPLIPFNAWYV